MPKKRQEPDISTPSAAWYLMEQYRELPRDLRGGLLSMQRCGKKHLWRATRELDRDYRRRVEALSLEPYYWSACQHLGGQPFTKMPVWSPDTPDPIVDVWAKDVDGNDRDFRSFAWSHCTSSVGFGLAGLLVTWNAEQGRPYIAGIPADAILDPYEQGEPMRLMFSSPNRDPDRPWIKWSEDQVWVLYDGEPTASGDEQYARWEVYEREDPRDSESPWNDSPTADLGGFFAPQEFTPFYSLYTGTDDDDNDLPWVCKPPLHDLAVLNRLQMNKRSDLDFGLHIANIPQRACAGMTDEEAKKFTTVSYKGIWYTASHQGKFYYVEHSGASFEVSFKDLETLQRTMEIFGHSPFVRRAAGSMTATEVSSDERRAITTAQAWALGWEDTWQQSWRCAARYGRMSDDFTLQLHTDFGPKEKDLDRAKMVQEDYRAGDLEPREYFQTMKGFGVYPEGFDVEAAATRIEKKREEDMARLMLAAEGFGQGQADDEDEEDQPPAPVPGLNPLPPAPVS